MHTYTKSFEPQHENDIIHQNYFGITIIGICFERYLRKL